MPSSDKDMLILKLSEVLGEKYVVCGSKIDVKEFIYNWKASSLFVLATIFS